MSHNYTRYSKMSGDEPMLIDTFKPEVEVEVQSEPIVEEESAIIEEPIEGQTIIPEVESEPEVVVEPEPEPTIEPEIRKIGKISGCKKLNVRKLPNTGATVVSELIEGAEVMIDEKASTATFYKVCTAHGIEGFCMKQFVKVLP